MFYIIELEDVIRVPPDKFGSPLHDVVKEILKARYESTMSPEFGYIIFVMDIHPDPVGKIVPGDGAAYHKAKFSALAYYPRIQELVEGEVVEVTDFGAFVRIGPTDAMLHLSQITDDYLTSDVRQGMIVASQSKRVLRIGSKVRVRITAVSMGRGAAMGKIGVTCRQPFLGALEWIEEEVAKARQAREQPAAPKKAGR